MSTAPFSRPCLYAIRALTYLAAQPPGKLSGTREISQCEGIPSPFLSKVLLQLRRGRLLRSYKGIGGGYELAQPAEKISLLVIAQCIDGQAAFDECTLENDEFATFGPGRFDRSWEQIRQQIRRFLEINSVADLARARQADAEVKRSILAEKGQ